MRCGSSPSGGPSMRTFQYSDARSNKFWTIELHGKSFTVTYGRSGSKGRTQTRTFAGEEQARREHDKLVREKLAKGYRETTAAAAPAGAATTQDESLCRALEAALVA